VTSLESFSPWRPTVEGQARDRLANPSLSISVALALGCILAVAAALRYVVWAADFPLHHDEALYGYWARLIVSGRDPLLLTAWVDKPPLVLYALAGALHWPGVSERALRLPGMIVSLATIACTWGLVRRLYDDRTALVSAALLAASPFAILFAPTAFTDPWLTLWLVAATWAAVAGRPFWAGVAVGLAVASKQQGVVAAPLIALLVAAGEHLHPRRADPQCPRPGHLLRRFAAALLGFALIFAPVTWWDTLRWAKRPSFWDRSLTTYGGLGWAPPATWPDRAADWAQIMGYWFGVPALTALMAGLALFAVLRERHRQRIGVLLAAFCTGYLAFHLVVTFQPWDRYLLPLLPFVCVLAGRGIVLLYASVLVPPRGAGRRLALRVLRQAVVVGLVALLGWAAWLGAAGRLPVGSDHGAYAGLDDIAGFFRDQPDNAIIYDRWLGWHFDFYLFDAPQERRWWGSGWKLADDAARTWQESPDRPQWVILPGWRDAAAAEVRLALASRRLALIEAWRVYRGDGTRAFTIYRIEGRAL